MIAAGSVIGMTHRLTSVPVSTLMSAPIDTAWGESTVPVGGTMVPAMLAGGGVGTGVRVRAMPEVGPPVITGSPTWFCQTFVPSAIVANRTYACVWSRVLGSTTTAKSIGTCVGPSIRCWPTMAPDSGAALVSTIETIATACGVSATPSGMVMVPVTAVVAAEIGTAIRPPARTASNANRRAAREGAERVDGKVRSPLGGPVASHAVADPRTG